MFYFFQNYEPGTVAYIEDEQYHFAKQNNFMRGRVIAAYSSLFNHSCNPNVQRTCTDDNKILYYSVLPIQKGSQASVKISYRFKLKTLISSMITF